MQGEGSREGQTGRMGGGGMIEVCLNRETGGGRE